jgi:hypothetical protein
MMRTRLAIAPILATMILAAAGSLAAHAQTANLAGTWKLNIAKSDLAGDHPFPDYTLTKKIVQSGESLIITDSATHASFVNIPMPDSTNTMQLATDGKGHEVPVPPSYPGGPTGKAQMTATWQGNNLELLEIINGLAIYATHRLFLSTDGNQLIDLAEQHTNYGDTVQRLVFDKAQ